MSETFFNLLKTPRLTRPANHAIFIHGKMFVIQFHYCTEKCFVPTIENRNELCIRVCCVFLFRSFEKWGRTLYSFFLFSTQNLLPQIIISDLSH